MEGRSNIRIFVLCCRRLVKEAQTLTGLPSVPPRHFPLEVDTGDFLNECIFLFSCVLSINFDLCGKPTLFKSKNQPFL